MRQFVFMASMLAIAGCGTKPMTESVPSTAANASTEKSSTPTAKPSLDGRWQIVSLLKDGKEFITAGAPMTIEYADGKQTMKQGGSVIDQCEYALDSSSTSLSIDTTHRGPNNSTATYPGIVEINGDDARICLSTKSNRPTDFTSTAEQNLITLKRLPK